MKNSTLFSQKRTQSSLVLCLLFALLFLGTLQPIHAQMNFTSKKTTGINEYITDFLVEGSNVYITTSGEGIFISTDGGKTFTNYKEKNGLESPYIDFITTNANTIYVATNRGLHTSTDGGKTFKGSPGSVNFITDKVVVNGSNVYVVGPQEGLYLSTDGGNSFTSKYGNSYLYYVAVDGKSIYLVAGDDTDKLELYVSTDNGDTFKKSPIQKDKLANTNSMIASNGTLYIGTNKGLVISTDGGQTCTVKKKADGLLEDAVSEFAVNGNKVYIGTSKGLSVSTDGGKTFLSDKTKPVSQLCVEGSTVHILSGNNYVVATGTPAPKAALPTPSTTYQLEFKHSSKVIQVDTGEGMGTGIAEGFGASIGVEEVPEGEIGAPIEGNPVTEDLVMDAALLQKTTDKTNKNQHWTFKDAGNGFYQILSSSNSEALELKGDGTDLFPSTGKSSSNATQLWKLEDAGNGYFRLLNKAANKYLEVPENDKAEDALLHYGLKSGDNQLIKFVKVQ